VIEQIERFRSEIEPPLFTLRNVFHDPNINVARY
jgi:hypothetical protein